MQINKIGYQQRFGASFINNEAMTNFTRNEVAQGRADELRKGLSDLSKFKTNLVLDIETNDNKNYIITNMYNGNKLTVRNMAACDISSLADPHTGQYKTLFADNNLTAAKINKISAAIAQKYYVTKAPDYALGQIIEKNC